jgi:subtilisin family serine protease
MKMHTVSAHLSCVLTLVIVQAVAIAANADADAYRTGLLSKPPPAQIPDGQPPAGDAGDLNKQDRHIYIIQFDAPTVYQAARGTYADSRKGGTRERMKVGAYRTLENHRSRIKHNQITTVRRMEALTGTSIQILRQYTYSLNAASVKMTVAEAELIRDFPGVREVTRNTIETVQLDTSPSWIGANRIWNTSQDAIEGSSGEGIVIGIIDTGINPSHAMFSEISPLDGYAHHNPNGEGQYFGVCDPGNPSYQPEFECNSKLIGAWYFLETFSDDPHLGAFDEMGHGSHVAGIASGNRMQITAWSEEFVASGVAPRSNIISYRACSVDGLCGTIDTLSAIEQAIIDGVDVINYSISGGYVPDRDPVAQAFLNAVDAGIFVAAAAGNTMSGQISHVSAWMTTVGAISHGYLFSHPLSFVEPSGNLTSLDIPLVPSWSTEIFEPVESKFVSYHLHYPDNLGGCDPFPPNSLDGRILLLARMYFCTVNQAAHHAFDAGAVAVIFSRYHIENPPYIIDESELPLPVFQINNEDSYPLLFAANDGPDTILSIGPSVSRVSSALSADLIQYFSSFGGTGRYSDVLKPDLVAPGLLLVVPERPEEAEVADRAVDEGVHQPADETRAGADRLAGVEADHLDPHHALADGVAGAALLEHEVPDLDREDHDVAQDHDEHADGAGLTGIGGAQHDRR